jgi:ABC-type bacteriocin/lantibiotic exporter with double-glycine peptidase domain
MTIIGHILYCLYYNINIHVENLLIIFGIIDSFQQPILTFCQTYSYYLISNVSTNRIEEYLYNKNDVKKNKNIKIDESNISIFKNEDINLDQNEIIFIIGDTGK